MEDQNIKQLLAKIDDVGELLSEIRAIVSGDAEELAGVVVVPDDEGQLDDVAVTLRQLKFLKRFYDAPGLSLTKSQTSEAAVDAGYDPRGTAGFYVGNGCLIRVGDQRVLTATGKGWYEQHVHLLGEGE